MAKSLAQTVVDEIEAFLARTGMPHTTFGISYNGDPSFVTRARRGRQMKSDTIDGVRRFMAEYRPSHRPRRRVGNDSAVAA